MNTHAKGNIRIVEFEPKYAASLAEMWNVSGESWGGDAFIRTEADIWEEQSKSTDLQTFLAVDGDTVAGFCSFSYYQEDEGAMYIPLLNVRPDYHGQKVGKALILNAVRRTIELDWPRLDLYTWAGNTKAVPAYKKCGFFWEKRDETTHLMNFIPSVLKTEAVSAFFESADWYNDGKRELALKPDGERADGFDFYTYVWEKDGRSLSMQYERSGRGLRKIETDDYSVETIVERHRLPFGAAYPVAYRIVNKSGAPLTVSVEGRGGKGIGFELSEKVSVPEAGGVREIRGTFELEVSDKEPSVWRTHPGVEAQLVINGRRASFKTGVAPVFPVELGLHASAAVFHPGDEVQLQLGIESRFPQETELTLSLPDSDVIAFEPKELTLTLPENGRGTVPVRGRILQPGVLGKSADISVRTGGRTLRVQGELEARFPGTDSVFFGETRSEWIAGAGRATIHLFKNDNQLQLRMAGQDRAPFWLPFPKLGPPFSDRFGEVKPSDVRLLRRGEAAVLEADYGLHEPYEVRLTLIAELSRGGVLNYRHRIVNLSGAPLPDDLRLKQLVPVSVGEALLPYDGAFLDLRTGANTFGIKYWDTKRLSENWMFFRSPEGCSGLVWPRELYPVRDRYRYAFLQPVGGLAPGDAADTLPLIFQAGTSADWRRFRAFALGREELSPQAAFPYAPRIGAGPGEPKGGDEARRPALIADHMTGVLNGGNPFLPAAFTAELAEVKELNLNGSLRIAADRGTVVPALLAAEPAQELRRVSAELTLSERPEADIVRFDFDMDAYAFKRSSLVFPLADAADRPVRTFTETEHGMTVLAAENGPLTIRSCPEYGPSLFSLRYRGREWLDSSFPQAGPRSFWNPWFGGIAGTPAGLTPRTIAEETIDGAFAELRDSLGNLWTGIRVGVDIRQNKKFQGLRFHHYFLLLPGAPVMAHTVLVEQSGGLPLKEPFFSSDVSYSASDSLGESRFVVRDAAGEAVVYKAGRYDIGSSFEGMLRVESAERPERLIVAPGHLGGDRQFVELDNALSIVGWVDRFDGRSGARSFTRPHFHILTDLDPDDAALDNLRGIVFDPDQAQI
ncbi:GNAT family N-acetyltransferase [Saccharibacillus sp. CPCC 101409]|uniref:GNAT family N-acetyltransferase n=1 Tax=Saccharibacillus sp. CPCC 101409 TaxID=3058041 RepID=UPI0026741EFA|nr:GNAT family N-acetyltransferase [Saccharibacillus sp. CPCC 101409]MDO3412545.1 GNAT family N-acetyltransferase [Saccharibacillus sp. CPCC 101409]